MNYCKIKKLLYRNQKVLIAEFFTEKINHDKKNILARSLFNKP